MIYFLKKEQKQTEREDEKAPQNSSIFFFRFQTNPRVGKVTQYIVE